MAEGEQDESLQEELFLAEPDVPPGAETSESSSWLMEVEGVIADEQCDFSKLRKVSKNRPFNDDTRPQAWQVLLGVSNRADPFANWDQVYDLAEQAVLRQECQRIVDALGNSEAERVPLTSDLESLLTVYCKTRALDFRADMGWSEVLRLLLVLRLPRAQLYNVFYALTTKYIPQGCVADGKPFDLFRLLLLYHDPHLCSALDTRNVRPHAYARHWFDSLFAAKAALPVALRMWDVYLQQADPFLVFFMALVMLLNAKDALLALDGAALAATIADFPCQLGADDIEDFCQLAAFYSTRTPQSFRRDYHGPLFGSNLADSFEHVCVHSLLCLPVSVQELLQMNQQIDSEQIHYFVVDARPLQQYSSGHLPGAYNLDASMIVNNPGDFQLAVASLAAFKEKTHPKDHLCFMGSGREEEDQYLHMVISNLLQRGHHYISLARGGYLALHEVLRESLSTRLKSHNVKGCIACSVSTSPPSTGARVPADSAKPASIFSQMRSLVKSRSVGLKEKVQEYVVNSHAASENARHVSSDERHGGGRRYRGVASAFSIGDDDDSSSGTNEAALERPAASPPPRRERLRVRRFLLDNAVDARFDCQQVDAADATLHSCLLALTKTQLFVLRPSEADADDAVLWARRPLSSVQKITSRKRMPELLTLKYGYEDAQGERRVTAVDRFVVPAAGDCAKALKAAIFALHEGSQQHADSA